MSSIKQIVLFYSTKSPHCRPIFQFLQQYNLPIIKVNVDSKNVRNAIKKGTYFSITGVPSMIVEQKDNVAQLYQGQKVLQYLNQMVQSIYVPQPTDEPPQDGQPSMGGQLPSQPIGGPPDIDIDLEPDNGPNQDYDILDDFFQDMGDDQASDLGQVSAPTSYKPTTRNIKEEKAAELKNIAKQMENERKRVLGIKEG